MREGDLRGGMRGMFPKAAALLIALALAPAARAQIFADVSTSLGDFTIELNHAAAPKTVANFIGLAEGSRAWVNPETGAIHTHEPYYEGITFHRVIADFMSQTGSRKGDGSDGPGYVFPDELDNGLTHSGPYVVSMANSGPVSNGSQFFITDAATPHLDGKHTVFGTISGGRDVVDAINNTPVLGEKPVTPVVIQSIAIRREGAGAGAFDIHAQGLPVVTRPEISLAVTAGAAASVTFTPPLAPRTQFRAFRSTDLAAWSNLGQLYIPMDAEPLEEAEGIETQAPGKAFYQFAAVSYPEDPAFSNPALAVYSVDFTTAAGAQTRSYVFNAAGTGGEATITEGGGNPVVIPFTLFDQASGPYVSRLVIDHGSSITPRYLRYILYADTGTGNSFGGRLSVDQYNGIWWTTWGSGTHAASR